jgi:hypothetical protein
MSQRRHWPKLPTYIEVKNENSMKSAYDCQKEKVMLISPLDRNRIGDAGRGGASLSEHPSAAL